jgi:hypothetical protein
MDPWMLMAVNNAILALQQLLINTNNGTLPANFHQQQIGIVLYSRTDIVTGYSIQINMDVSSVPETPVSITVQFTGARGGLILNDP